MSRWLTWNDAGMVDVCLGTAQWGSAYGVTNTAGELDEHAIAEVMDTACSLGLRRVDTAAAYGRAQVRLRPWAPGLLITTKVSGSSPSRVLEEIQRSLDELGVSAVDGVLLHDWETLNQEAQEGAVRALATAHGSGHVSRVGVSVYEERSIDEAFRTFEGVDLPLGLLQVPANALDRRLDGSHALHRAKDAGSRIQVRSVLLQGLLASPMAAGLGTHADIQRFHQWAKGHDLSPIEVALRHALALTWADEIVIGVTSAGELETVARISGKTAPELAPLQLQSHDDSLLDPRKW